MNATQSTDFKSVAEQNEGFSIKRYLPFLDWLLHYRRANLSGDVIAGIIVAVMLVPQSMAYALLAGLPAQVGLYASIVPLMLYGLLGTSRALAVGPVAMVSLLVASGVGALNPASTEEYVLLAITLAFLVGIIQMGMGVLRVGFLVNFLSHPVLSGFTSAAALIIGFSQLKHILGFSIPRSEHFHETLLYAAEHITQTNPAALVVGLLSIAVLFFFKLGLAAPLRRLGLPEGILVPLTKLGPLVIVAIGTLLVAAMGLNESANLSIVGEVPAGLPPLGMPSFDMGQLGALLPIAITISLVGFMESISVAKALASKRREKIDANQELIALGAANLGATFTGGYPVTGGFSRSMVNFTAGANTGLASIITAALVLLTVLFLTPLFYFLPNAVLAAIIVVAVTSLLDWKTVQHTWHYSKADFISLVVTFFATLELGIETGILVGVATSLALFLWRTSRPHYAIVGRVGETEEYRNVLRHETCTNPKILALRVDGSLYFPNAQYLEEVVLNNLAEYQEVEHFILVCSAVNYIDTSALEVLETLYDTCHENGVSFNMAEVKGPVMDRLKHTSFAKKVTEEHCFLTTHEAVTTLEARMENGPD